MSHEHKAVESGNLESASYDSENRELQIKFKRSDRLYTYKNVPAEVGFGLFRSKSAGEYFHAFVRDRYRFE